MIRTNGEKACFCTAVHTTLVCEACAYVYAAKRPNRSFLSTHEHILADS